MSYFSNLTPGKKTALCLLGLMLFTYLLFLKSVSLREKYLASTYSVGSLRLCEGCKPRYDWHTASTLVFVNNWLQEGAWNLRFGLFDLPRAVETPTLDKRAFYPAYPPGAMLPVYVLFKLAQASGIIGDLEKNRGSQLLLLVAYNYLLHLLLVMLLSFAVFLVLRNMQFDRGNAAVLAAIPVLIQFHNAHSLYWHHKLYTFDQAVLLPYVAFVLLELLRMLSTSRRITIAVQILQPLLIFYGVFTDWLFVFIALTAYVLRIIRGEIVWPRSFNAVLRFVAGSFLFFLPVLAALSLWAWQVLHFSEHSFLSAIAENSEEVASGYDMRQAFLIRTGAGVRLEGYLHYLKRVFYTWLRDGYGFSGVLVLYATAYCVWRGRKIATSEVKFDRVLISFYTLLFVPCILHMLFFINHSWQHVFSSLKLSFALSLSFVVLPLLILQIRGKPANFVVAKLAGRADIYATTALSLAGACFYVYLQIYDRLPLTHFFARPDYRFAVLGEYIRKNSTYEDVLFSSSVIVPAKPPQSLSLSGKRVYLASNLDHIYPVVSDIEQDFRVKILYLDEQAAETQQLATFLEKHDFTVTRHEEKDTGGLLEFDGRSFMRWYEQTVPAAERDKTAPARLILLPDRRYPSRHPP